VRVIGLCALAAETKRLLTNIGIPADVRTEIAGAAHADRMRRASRILDEDGRAVRGVEPRKGCWLLRHPRWNSRRLTHQFPRCARADWPCSAGVPIGKANSESVIGAPEHLAFMDASVKSGAQHKFAGEGVRSYPGNFCTTVGEIAHDAWTHPFAVKDPCGCIQFNTEVLSPLASHRVVPLLDRADTLRRELPTGG
jgi:hypothetical protein